VLRVVNIFPVFVEIEEIFSLFVEKYVLNVERVSSICPVVVDIVEMLMLLVEK
jgi:hypothetical protein